MNRNVFAALAALALSGTVAADPNDWVSKKELQERNREMRAEIERDAKIAEEIRKREEDAAPRRAAAQKEREENGITVPEPKRAITAETRQYRDSAPSQSINTNDAKIEAWKAEITRSLFDPESARFRDVSILSDGRVCGWVNGKNRFGGYVGFELMCSDPGYRPRGGPGMTWSN